MASILVANTVSKRLLTIFTFFENIAFAYTAPTNEMGNAFSLTPLNSSTPATLYPRRSSLGCRKVHMGTTLARSKSEPVKASKGQPTRMSNPVTRPDDNLRSRRLPRSKGTRCCLPRARSPSPEPYLPDPSEEEPFPDFDHDGCEEWKENSINDGWSSYPEYLEHCTKHCTHYVCTSQLSFNKQQAIQDPECSCPQLPPSESQEQDRIANLTHSDVAQAKTLYETTPKDMLITVELDAAGAIVHKLHYKRLLDIKSHLRNSPFFPKEVLFHPKRYHEATRAANHIPGKLLSYLILTLCYSLPSQSRCLTIEELEAQMQAVMRYEILWFVAEWCFRQKVHTRDEARDTWRFGAAREMWADRGIKGSEGKVIMRRGQEKVLWEGMRVLMERGEGVVRKVVEVLVWWDKVGREDDGGENDEEWRMRID